MGVLSFFAKGKYREVTDTNGLPVVSSGSNYLEATLQDAVKKNDDGTAMTVAGYASLVLQVSGAFTATVNFEATQDGTNWVAILAQDKNAGSQATTTTTAGIFEIPVAGLKQVRARVSGYSAGAVTVKGTALPQSLAGLFSATINATVDGVKVKDSTGTNTLEIDADGNAPVKLSGSYLTVDPETGVKTVTTTAAELFAGSVVLDGRYKMIVYNEGSNNVYWGNSTITAQTGFPLLPGDSVIFTFNPTEDMPIYFRAEANTVVRVGELA